MPPLTGLRKKWGVDNYKYVVPNGTANPDQGEDFE